MDLGVSYQGEARALRGNPLNFSMFKALMDVGVSYQGEAIDLRG